MSLVEGDRGDLLVITRWGNYIRFPQRTIETHGSQALELEPGDEVAAALSVPEDQQVLMVTASGYAMRRHTEGLSRRTKPGVSGRKLMQAQDVLAAFPYLAEAQIALLTYSGKLLLFPAKDVDLRDRYGKGTRLHNLGRDPAIAVTLLQEPS